MFAAYDLGRLGSPMNNVAFSFRTDLLLEETIDTNHPPGIFKDANARRLDRARMRWMTCDLQFQEGLVWRMWFCETCLDLELREPLSDAGNISF